MKNKRLSGKLVQEYLLNILAHMSPKSAGSSLIRKVIPQTKKNIFGKQHI